MNEAEFAAEQSTDQSRTRTTLKVCGPCAVGWNDGGDWTANVSALTPPPEAATADAAMQSTKLIEFAHAVLSLLTTPEWDAGLLDDIAAEAYTRNLAHSGEDDLFTLS